MAKNNILKRSTLGSMLRILSHPCYWSQTARTLRSINANFFALQKKAAKKKIDIPVVNVEHPLDAEIPFTPRYVRIYMDFSSCWVRALAFLSQNFGRRARPFILDYLEYIEKMYIFAAQVYKRIMSTTRRPRYTKLFLFRVIYAFDPHLMCIPSLHVMIVVFLYTKIKDILKSLDADKMYEAEAEALFRHAVAITDSILFVKQHSVNCVAAGMYAAHRFVPSLFTLDEAERFAGALLRHAGTDGVSENNTGKIRAHITELFAGFVMAGKSETSWENPLIDFLASKKISPASCV